MATKVFLLGGVGALVGFVSCGGSVDRGNSPPTDNPTPSGPVGVVDAGPAQSCKLTTTFTPPTINPPTAPVNVCTKESLDAIVDGCLLDLAGQTTTTCLLSREAPANKACGDCIFGSKNDANWKVINIEQGKAAHFNQAGCIEHVTGVVGCGSAYETILDCLTVFCPDSTARGRCDEQTTPACFDEVTSNECRQFRLGQICGSAIQSMEAQLEQTCFLTGTTQAAAKTFFINIVKTSCMKQ
jgi:hypothetical protein